MIPPRTIPHGPRNVWAYPRLWDQDFLHRIALRKVVRRIASEIPPASQILDVGCGWLPYKAYFQENATHYIGADITPYPDPDFRLIENGRLPAGDASIDVCLCWQVLEHVESLDDFFTGVRRILKPGAQLFLTTHGHFRIHAQEDYWRWTANGLRRIFEDQNFRDISVTAVDSSASAAASFQNNLLVMGLEEFLHLPRHRTSQLAAPVVAFTNLWSLLKGALMEKAAPRSARQDPTTYLVSCRI